MFMRDEKFWVMVMGAFVVWVFVFSLANVGLRFTGFVVYEDIGEGQTVATFESSDIVDARVYGSFSSRNYGLSDELYVKWGSPKYNSYLGFDLSVLLSGQVIDAAEVCLYLFNDQAAQTIGVYHVYSEWGEGSLDNDVCGDACDVTENVTWDNQPCGFAFDNSDNCNLSAEDSVSNDGGQDGTWQCWDVSRIVKSEYDLGNDSVSMVLHTDDNGNADVFYSREYSDVSLRPYLNVTYHFANVAPVVNIVSFVDGEMYVDNESLGLDYNVVDSNLDSCWYSLSGVNVSLPGCGNVTFDVGGSGNYVLSVYANDSFGEESVDSVSFSVDVEGVSVSLSEPVGEKSSRTGIGIVYSVDGADDCWYNVETSIGGGVIGNTSLENCSGSSFDVSADGDYVLNLFVNNSYGSFGFDSSNFSVDSSEVVISPSGASSGGGGGGGSVSGGFFARLEIDSVDVIVSHGEEKNLLVGVKNIGSTSANKCFLDGGDFVDSSDIYNIGVGEIVEFSFVLRALGGVEGLELRVRCLNNVSGIVHLGVEVLRPDLDVSILGLGFDSSEELRIDYSVEPTRDSVSVLYFRILDSDGEIVSEVVEDVELVFGEVYEGTVMMDIVDVDEGMLRVAISDGNVDFVEEDFVYGGGVGVTGFAFFEWGGDISYIGIVLIVFLVLAGLLVRRIWKLKKGSTKKR
jgi:hypothetical protein